MYWKSLTIFFSICFIALISLEAIADDKTPNLCAAEVQGLESQLELVYPQETQKSSDQVHSNEKKASDSLAKAAVGAPKLKKPIAETSHLSFNFIYYILYKFKYIDSFGLSAPEKSTQQKKETIVWH